MAITEGMKETLWLRGMIEELGVKQDQVVWLCDGQSANYLTKNQGYYEKTKHINVRMHFAQHIMDDGKVSMKKIHFEDNPADMPTKPVTTIKFERCLSLIGVAGNAPG